MKNLILVSIVALTLNSCGVFENKEKQAIEICQKTKINLGLGSMANEYLLNNYGLNENSTWLDFANTIAQKQPNEKLTWIAESDSQVYIVAFVDKRRNGYRWEVNIKDHIVKYINLNKYLTRKYNLTRLSGSDEFEITSIQKDTLRIVKSYYDSDPKVIYEFEGAIRNNTDKSITEATISGRLELIFEEKTISEESDNYDDGFTSTISKHKPWKQGEERKFKLKTEGIDIIYADYEPPYAIFEIELKAEDPVGYTFSANIKEYDVLEAWKGLR